MRLIVSHRWEPFCIEGVSHFTILLALLFTIVEVLLRWWDYTGIFLNINDRICAEGLLVFGIGGMAIVYILAPIIDNKLKKFSLKTVILITLILISLFTFDLIYSHNHANTGNGITSVPISAQNQ